MLRAAPSHKSSEKFRGDIRLKIKKLKGQIQTEGGGIVNMRDQPSEDGALVSPIPTGAEVIIFRYGGDTALKNGEQGRWCRIAYDAKIGWVWGKYVKEKE